MLALPPILPPASTVYSVANEQAFRTALLRYFQQQRTDATVVDPGQAPSALNGTLVKSVGGGALGNTMVTEASGVLLVSEALRVTGATILAAALGVGGSVTVGGAVSATGLIVSASTVQGTRLISTIATGTAPLTVASTTVVTNLNADLLDGQHGAFYQDAGNLNAGTLLSARLTGAYAGITGIGTLVSGAVPASLVTAGTFGAGDYVFPTSLTIVAGTVADSPGSVLTKTGSGGVDFAGGAFRITRGPSTPTASLRFAGSVGTVAIPVAPSGALDISVLNFQAWDGSTSLYQSGARIIASATDAWSASNWRTDLKLQNVLAGTTALRTAVEMGSDGSIHFFNNQPDVYGVFFGNSWDITRNTATAADYPALSLVRTRGSRFSEAAVLASDALGQYQWSGWNGAYYVSTVIQSFATENWGGAASGSNMVFRVTATGAVVPTTVLTLTSALAAFGSTLITAGTYNGQTITSAASLTGSLQTTTGVGIGTAPQTFTALIAGLALSGSTTQRGIQSSVVFGTGATSFAQGFRAVPTFASGAYTTANYAGLYVGAVALGGGGHAITTVSGLYIEAQTVGAANRSITTLGGSHLLGGDVLAGTDNTYDFGASGATRFRAAFIAQAAIVGRTITSTITLADGDCVSYVGYCHIDTGGELRLDGDSELEIT